MKKWTDDIMPADLPGELLPIAEEIGVEAALKLSEKFGGGAVYLPQASSVIASAKQRFILDNPKMQIKDLRMATGYSDRQIIRIRGEADSVNEDWQQALQYPA